MIIIGIDPGLRNVGYGVIEVTKQKFIYLRSGVLKIPVNLALEKRLQLIYCQLLDIISMALKEYKGKLILGAVEEVFVNKNGKTTLLLGHARACALLALVMVNIDVTSYSPNKIKKTISSFGHAGKEQMINMVNLLLPLAPVLKSDEADALAIAICHAMHNQNNQSKDRL